MRSHLEEQVADLLDEMKIEYQYESEKIPYMIEAIISLILKLGILRDKRLLSSRSKKENESCQIS